MQKRKTNNYGAATAWAMIAMLGFAAQHPLEKPLLDEIGDTPMAYVSITLAGEIVLIVALVLGLATSAKVRNAFWFLASPENRWHTIGMSALSVITAPLYAASLKFSNPIYLSLILNLYPIWNIFVIALWNQKLPPWFAWIAAAVAFFGICLSSYLANDLDHFIWASFFRQFLIYSVIPILFSVRTIWFNRRYGGGNVAAKVLVLSAFDMPFALISTVLLMLVYHQEFMLPNISVTSSILFIFAILASGIFGVIGLQNANDSLTNEEQYYPGYFFFLIPLFVMLIGLFVAALGIGNSHFQLGLVPGGIVVAVVIFLFNLKAAKKREVTSEKNEKIQPLEGSLGSLD